MRHIESLESRQLLSAAPHAKVKPTIPNIITNYTGTSQETHPHTDAEDISLSIASETTKWCLQAHSSAGAPGYQLHGYRLGHQQRQSGLLN